jgi:serine protease AprX
VDVALVDTGVAPVDGLPASRVINGPDLSFESQFPETEYLDTMGHGTHMAGIIAGDDKPGFGSDEFQGIAPKSRIVSIKVGQADGAADVSQVIAAIDWVVQHRNDNGMNIRVLNLSYGTDGVQDYVLDPLTFAVEQAWFNDIVVVVAAGNAGLGTPKLNNPAYDPYVIAAGGDDTKGTIGSSDDIVPEWSSRGNAGRHPDFVAPGQSIVSLRAEGSFIDEEYPTGRVGTRFFKGSGTSQSAAVVSGTAALLLSRYPYLTPDRVKAYLVKTASALPLGDVVAQGAGLANLSNYSASVPNSGSQSKQSFPRATGAGLLELARGTAHVSDPDGNEDGIEDDPIDLKGEFDIFGMPFSGKSWSILSAAGKSWSGGVWNGSEWTGGDWSGTSWSGKSWSGKSWSGKSWSGKSWSGKSWSGKSWSGKSWSGKSWSGKSWSGKSWSGYLYE